MREQRFPPDDLSVLHGVGVGKGAAGDHVAHHCIGETAPPVNADIGTVMVQIGQTGGGNARNSIIYFVP